MKTVLPVAITTIEQAKAYLTDLYNNGEAYHPEDNAHSIAWSLPVQPTTDEREQLNKLMNDIYALKRIDPCEFILDLDSRPITITVKGDGPVRQVIDALYSLITTLETVSLTTTLPITAEDHILCSEIHEKD